MSPSVLLQHRPERFGEQGSAWDVEQRGLEQDEGVDEFRRVERQPQGDDPAGGMADDVGTLDAEVPQKGAAVGSFLAETERRSDRAAAGVAASVVAHQAVAAVQGQLGAERRVRLGDEGTVDQQDRLAGARDLELELRSVDARPLHGFGAH